MLYSGSHRGLVRSSLLFHSPETNRVAPATRPEQTRCCSGRNGRRVAVLALFILAICAISVAQNGPDNDPDAAQGYVNSAFHHSSVESINLYNGQLTIPIAIGPSYSVGPKLRFQAMLTYNSRVSEYGHPPFPPPPPFLPPTQAFKPLSGDPALGIGWNFHLGAIKPCSLAQASRCYVSPDGAEHLFNQPVDASHFKTREGSQFILHYINNVNEAQGYEMWDGDGNRYTFAWQVTGYDDGPSNYIHDFGRGRNGWYLTSLRDPFSNQFTVSYYSSALASPCPSASTTCPNTTANPDTSMRCTTAGSNSWVPQTIGLPGGFSIAIALDGAKMIKTISFPVLAGGQATSAVWTLNYRNDVGGGPYCAVPLVELSEIVLPPVAGAPKYLFDYVTTVESGLLAKITLPTSASVAYDYGDYSYYHARVGGLNAGCGPAVTPMDATIIKSSPPGSSAPAAPASTDPCVPEGVSDYIDVQSGVLRKTETIPTSSGTITAVTNYTQYAFPFGEQGTSGAGNDNSQTLTVVVEPPDINGQVSARGVLFWGGPRSGTYLKCPGTSRWSPCAGDRTGAELREAVYDHDPNTPSSIVPMPACGGNDVAFCPSHAVRVAYRTYEYDDPTTEWGNRRLKTEVTYHQATASNGTCPGCKFHQIDSTLTGSNTWEGNGRHYNQEAHTGLLGANDARSAITVWTPGNWTALSAVPPLMPLPNLFSRRTESDTTLTVDRYLEFDALNGFLNCSIVYDTVRARALFNRRYPTTTGALLQEFTASSPSPVPTPNVCTNQYLPLVPMPAVGNNGDSFGKVYTHQNGLLTSTRWMNVTTPAGWYAKRFDRDSRTGWVTSSYDSTGLATLFSYDLIGRITAITPPGEAVTTVSYPSALKTTASRNGGMGLITYQEYDYDGLGRLSREIRSTRSTPTNQYAVRTHAFDAAGHATFDSEWGLCTTPSTDCQSVAPAGTTSSLFDPFDRVQRAVRADGSTTTVSFADTYSTYSDTKKTVTTKNVGGLCASGACSGGSDSSSVFVSDAFGRMTSVTEPGGDLTKYNYDLNGKLTCVKQGGTADMSSCTSNSGGQYRSFVYDPNGFLMQETTPEKGAVTYDCYGSLGNIVLQSPPGVQLANNYDFAGRLTATRSNEVGPAFSNPCVTAVTPSGGRLYTSNTYNNSTPGSSYGRLTSRVGSSFLQPGAGTSYDVTDAFAYGGLGGRVSARTTTVSGSGLSTTQGWMYNGLGLLAHHYHPRSPGQFPLVVSWGYDAGLPVKAYVNGIPMVKGVGYAPSGAVSAYTTGPGFGADVTTTIAQDPLVPRPASIATSGASLNFSTGTYGYDGAGNIKAMGTIDSFGYDLRSRLTSATLQNLQGSTVSQAFSYDRYGNLLTKGATTYSVSASTNRLTTAAYDVRGNVTTNGGDTYAYDGLDRMEYNRISNGEWDYVYDAGGERLVKIPPLGASWAYTFRDEGNRLSTEYSAATPSRDNIYLGSLLVASYANGAVQGNGAVWTFYASDHLGTPRLITNVIGTMIEQRKTWPFGEDLGTQATSQRVKFAAMERDVEGANAATAGSRYYDHARSHEFNLGRFLTPDKLGGRLLSPQTWNRYSYTVNNPMRFFDPNGLVEVEVTFRHFIQGATALSPFGLFQGDNRGFSLNPNLTSRTEQRIRVETDPTKRRDPLISKEPPKVGSTLNRTFGLSGQATGDSMHINAARGPNGSVVITASQNEGIPRSASFAIGTLGLGIASTVSVTIDPSGNDISATGTRSSYPSLEINISEFGRSFSLYQGNQSWTSFGLANETLFTARCTDGATSPTCSQSESEPRPPSP